MATPDKAEKRRMGVPNAQKGKNRIKKNGPKGTKGKLNGSGRTKRTEIPEVNDKCLR